MNIKRAFFAATAALMIPGFAMAQVDISVPTTVDFTPDADTVTLTATLNCNSGNPLQQAGDISEAVGLTFSVLQVAEGSVCSVVLSGIPAGWDDSGDCDFTTTDATEYLCNFDVTQVGIEYEVTKAWEDPDSALSNSDYAEVDVMCENLGLLGNGTYSTTTRFYVGDADADGEEVATFYPGTAHDTDEADEMTFCVAEEVFISNSSASGDAGCETPTVYMFGGDSEKDCTITNTVVYEGIPTLSQYGMAIMVLLMLGVGFVGFRRFV